MTYHYHDDYTPKVSQSTRDSSEFLLIRTLFDEYKDRLHYAHPCILEQRCEGCPEGSYCVAGTPFPIPRPGYCYGYGPPGGYPALKHWQARTYFNSNWTIENGTTSAPTAGAASLQGRRRDLLGEKGREEKKEAAAGGDRKEAAAGIEGGRTREEKMRDHAEREAARRKREEERQHHQHHPEAMQKEVGKHDKKEYVESAEHRMKTMEKERRLKKERWLREKELANAPMEGANDPLPGLPFANERRACFRKCRTGEDCPGGATGICSESITSRSECLAWYDGVLE
ncbi:hypothetical protein CYMTET_29474 [Cymbomonas tetramitiformis]|uniref:Uncharacterized protein n=1 Tax=Cymbomonas tetramitiformis TaxID=36881 RepID=A0AAE0FL01_9CHLO|nr:hypothetical protein CYMTET_29474 [Cymbomonas tetramitiformis]